jgi:hypothetical protein
MLDVCVNRTERGFVLSCAVFPRSTERAPVRGDSGTVSWRTLLLILSLTLYPVLSTLYSLLSTLYSLLFQFPSIEGGHVDVSHAYKQQQRRPRISSESVSVAGDSIGGHDPSAIAPWQNMLCARFRQIMRHALLLSPQRPQPRTLLTSECFSRNCDI